MTNVTLRQLRAFIAVADTASFTAAALRLHLTPSAASLLIKELEAGTGIRLFERSTRRVTLTPAGEEFLPLAGRVLEDLERALASARGLQEKRRGSVRLACTQLYAATLLPPLLAGYRARFPDIEVVLLDSLNQQALSRVVTGEADLAIAPQRPTPASLESRTILRDRISLFCLAEHPLASRRSVAWQHVLREPFVSLTQDFTARLQADLLRHADRLQLQPAYSVSFVTTAFGMVRAGYGITAQPDVSLPLAAPFGIVQRRLTDPVVYRELCLYVRREATLTPAAESFVEHVLASLDPGPGARRGRAAR